jgi:hypothetical protein
MMARASGNGPRDRRRWLGGVGALLGGATSAGEPAEGFCCWLGLSPLFKSFPGLV